MVRSKRLKPIKDLAKNNEKVAAAELGQSLEKQRSENQKLEQLFAYRREYLHEMEVRVKQGMTGATLQRYHHFLAKLDLAIAQQQEALELTRKQLDASQDLWQEKRSRSKAISQVMDKMAVEEQREQDKKEARQIDEMSTQAFLRSR